MELHDVNQYYIDDGKAEANGQLDQQLPAPLGLRWIHVGPVNIQHDGQTSSDAQGGGADAEIHRPDQSDLDVAEASAVEPVGEVCIGPDEGVDAV